MHRAYSSVVLALGLLAMGGCAGGEHHAALGWSLGGEAHVFIADNRFARDFYHDLTGKRDLSGALEGHALIAIDTRDSRRAAVLSANGAAPARLTLARFHAAGSCGAPDIVTELVLAFPPGGAAGHSAPSHGSVVALLDADPVAHRASPRLAPLLATAAAREFLRRVADHAEHATRGQTLGLLHPLTVDADQAADAGEIVPLSSGYAVGFRASYVGPGARDTILITGVATTDLVGGHVRWVVKPRRLRLTGGTIARASAGVRYSLRGAFPAVAGEMLLLVDEFADVSPRDSRATAVDARTRHVVAAQPLALRCP